MASDPAVLEPWSEAIKVHAGPGGAVKALAILSGIQSKTAKIWFNIGQLEQEGGNHAEAVRALSESIAKDKYSAVAYFNRGVSSYTVANFAEALQDFEKALQYLHDNIVIDYKQLHLKFALYKCVVFHNIGLTLDKLGKAAEASAAFSKAADSGHQVLDEHDACGKKSSPLFTVDTNDLFVPNKSKVANMKGNIKQKRSKEVAVSANAPPPRAPPPRSAPPPKRPGSTSGGKVSPPPPRPRPPSGGSVGNIGGAVAAAAAAAAVAATSAPPPRPAAPSSAASFSPSSSSSSVPSPSPKMPNAASTLFGAELASKLSSRGSSSSITGTGTGTGTGGGTARLPPRPAAPSTASKPSLPKSSSSSSLPFSSAPAISSSSSAGGDMLVIKMHRQDTRRFRIDRAASVTALRQKAKQKFGGDLPSLCTFWYKGSVGGGAAAAKLEVLNAIRLQQLAGKRPELELWVSDSDKSPAV